MVDLKTEFVGSGFLTFMLFPRMRLVTNLLSALIPADSYSPGPGLIAVGIAGYINRFSVVPKAPMLDCQFLRVPSAFLAEYCPGPGNSLP